MTPRKGRRQFGEDRRRAFRAVWAAHRDGLTPLPLNELIGYVQFARIRGQLEGYLKENGRELLPGDPPPDALISAIRNSSLTPEGLKVTVSAVRDLADRLLIDISDGGEVKLTPVGQRAGYLQGL